MELDLQSLFGLHACSICTAVLLGRKTPQPATRSPPPPPPSPRIWAHIRGRYWSAKIDDISLWPPVAAKAFVLFPIWRWRKKNTESNPCSFRWNWLYAPTPLLATTCHTKKRKTQRDRVTRFFDFRIFSWIIFHPGGKSEIVKKY